MSGVKQRGMLCPFVRCLIKKNENPLLLTVEIRTAASMDGMYIASEQLQTQCELLLQERKEVRLEKK